jgi:hypothetical protein
MHLSLCVFDVDRRRTSCRQSVVDVVDAVDVVDSANAVDVVDAVDVVGGKMHARGDRDDGDQMLMHADAVLDVIRVTHTTRGTVTIRMTQPRMGAAAHLSARPPLPLSSLLLRPMPDSFFSAPCAC